MDFLRWEVFAEGLQDHRRLQTKRQRTAEGIDRDDEMPAVVS